MTLAPVQPQRRALSFRRRLLIASVAALVITLAAWWRFYPAVLFPFRLEVAVQSFTPAAAQVYYDRGTGLREADSTRQPLNIGQTLVRLPLPPGRYQELRFDPIDRPGSATFGELRVVGPGGGVIRAIPLSELRPNDQIGQLHVNGDRLEMATKQGASDPQFSIAISPPLELKFELVDQLWAARWWLLVRFAACVAALLIAANTWRNRAQRRLAAIAFIHARPRAALAVCAALAAITSSYPVVFFGKSFISPNATMLLYNSLPSVPGYSDSQAEDARGADVGAMMWQHLPYTVQENRALRSGTLPLWNRFASCGVTLLGQGQSMLGDPLQLLVVATNAAPWAFDLKYLLAKALFGCGLAWCVWALTRDFAASAMLGFASVFIAFFNYRLNHPSIFTMGYAPWILVAWFHLAASPDRRSFRRSLLLWYAANWMVITSGTVKEAYLLGLSLNLTGAVLYFVTTRRADQKMRRALILAWAGVAFALTTCPLWWTFLEALATAYTNYDVPGIGQVPGHWLIGFFDDLFYREFMPWHNIFKPATNFLILLGCLWAVLQPRRLFRSPGALIVAGAALVALSLAFHFGPLAWPAAWLLAVPLLRNVYNLDTVFSCVAIVLVCVLAGWGFSAARQPLIQGRTARFAWMMAGIVLALFAFYFAIAPTNFAAGHAWHGWSGLTVDDAIVYANVLLLPLSAWALVIIAGRRLRGLRLGVGNATIVAVALLILLGRHGQHLRFVSTTYVAAPGVRADLQIPSESVRFFQRNTKSIPGRVMGLERNVFPGFVTLYGLEVINGANALENRPYRQFAEAAGLVKPGEWIYDLRPADLPMWRPIADFLNVRYLAAPGNISFPTTGYREVATFDFKIFESEHVWPRAFFTDRVEHYRAPADLVTLIRNRANGGPFAAMQDGDPMPDLPPPAATSAAPAVVAARHYELGINHTAFTLQAPGAGVAVLQEAWLPDDFRVTLNGKHVPYFRVNHAFRGVAIPAAGTYRVEYSYWPRGFTLSLWASAGGLLLVIASLSAANRFLAAAPAIASPSSVS